MKVRLIGKKFFLETMRRKGDEFKKHELQVYLPVKYGVKRGDFVLVQKAKLIYNRDGKIVKYKRIGLPFIKRVGIQRIYLTKPGIIFEKDKLLFNKIEIVEEEKLEVVE